MRRGVITIALLSLAVCTLVFGADATLKNVVATDWMGGIEYGYVIPRHENGYFLTFAPEGGHVILYDRAGVRLMANRITLPEAFTVRIDRTAVSRQGQVVASINADGRDGKMLDGLVWLDSSGAVEKFVRTTPFAARWLSFAEDGNLWALGDVYDATRGNQPVEEHDLLWKFDAQGKRVQTMLPRSSFHWPDQVASRCGLAVNGDTVGVFFMPKNEWVELSTSGKVVRRESVPLPKRSNMIGVTLG
jgi:hypothetical protein